MPFYNVVNPRKTGGTGSNMQRAYTSSGTNVNDQHASQQFDDNMVNSQRWTEQDGHRSLQVELPRELAELENTASDMKQELRQVDWQICHLRTIRHLRYLTSYPEPHDERLQAEISYVRRIVASAAEYRQNNCWQPPLSEYELHMLQSYSNQRAQHIRDLPMTRQTPLQLSLSNNISCLSMRPAGSRSCALISDLQTQDVGTVSWMKQVMNHLGVIMSQPLPHDDQLQQEIDQHRQELGVSYDQGVLSELLNRLVDATPESAS